MLKDAKKQNNDLKIWYDSEVLDLGERFPDGRGGSWVTMKVRRGVACIGCSFCAKACRGTAWAKFTLVTRDAVTPTALYRHADTRSHKAAVEETGDTTIAPPKADFRKVLTDPTGCDDMGAKKVNAMRWCLSEGKMDIEREQTASAHSALFSQDASQGTLCCRESVSTLKFKNLRFIIGYATPGGYECRSHSASSKAYYRTMVHTAT